MTLCENILMTKKPVVRAPSPQPSDAIFWISAWLWVKGKRDRLHKNNIKGIKMYLKSDQSSTVNTWAASKACLIKGGWM